MAYAIILGFIVVVVAWGAFMSRRAKAGHAEKQPRSFHRGAIRRYAFGGRKIVQSDEQRSEVILENRERYDPSIDRLDPRHKDYQGPDSRFS
jgi:hypothetical protein